MKGFYYEQATGAFGVFNGSYVYPLGSGYAGKGASRNVPNDDHRRGLGPLPRGKYSVAVAKHDRFAAPAIRLEQIEGTAYGRSGFWVHGDNKAGDASSGCIILTKPVRMMMASFIAFGHDVLVVRP